MYDQFSTLTQQFTATAARLNRLALENAESAFEVQLRTFGKNVDATTAYLNDLAGARDVEAFKTLWPKGLQVARDNVERTAAAGQELFGLTLKTTEALTQLTKSQFDAAAQETESAVKEAAEAAPKAPKAVNK